ncbi:MAG: hypothetical protein J0L94_09365 [Rhodothermia bacterium]|nr:hypothetical protein [Rhodothermia bacterium]
MWNTFITLCRHKIPARRSSPLSITSSVFFMLFSGLWMLGCGASTDPSSMGAINMREATARGNHAFRQAVRSGRVENIVQLYTPQARLSAPYHGFVMGRSPITSWWQQQLSNVKDLRKQTLTVNGNEFMIYETGLAYWKTTPEKGLKWRVTNYLQVWRVQSDGSYLLDAEAWNFHRPHLIDEQKIPRF